MVQPTTRRGTKLRALMGNGATPTEVFDAFCAVNAKEIAFESQTNDFYVGDCDAPDDPAWRQITKSGRSVGFTGSGTLDMRDLARYQEADASDQPSNWRIELDITNLTEGGYWSGKFMLTNLSITGNDEDLVQVSFTLASHGPVIWTDAA